MTPDPKPTLNNVPKKSYNVKQTYDNNHVSMCKMYEIDIKECNAVKEMIEDSNIKLQDFITYINDNMYITGNIDSTNKDKENTDDEETPHHTSKSTACDQSLVDKNGEANSESIKNIHIGGYCNGTYKDKNNTYSVL